MGRWLRSSRVCSRFLLLGYRPADGQGQPALALQRAGTSAQAKQAVLHDTSGWLGCSHTFIPPFSLTGHHAEMIIAAAGMKGTGWGLCLQLLFTMWCPKTVPPFLVLMKHWSVKWYSWSTWRNSSKYNVSRMITTTVREARWTARGGSKFILHSKKGQNLSATVLSKWRNCWFELFLPLSSSYVTSNIWVREATSRLH